MFCVYLTTYFGHKLPPFYIGSTSCVKASSGYRGSVTSIKYKTTWDSELSDNPQLFITRIISTHRTRSEALAKELRLHELLSVVRSPMYINMATASVKGCFGRDVSGENNPNFGKRHTEEAKAKMRTPRVLSDTERERRRRYRSTQTTRQWEDAEWSGRQLNRMQGDNHPNKGRVGSLSPLYGRKHTNETKHKIKTAILGTRRTQLQIKRGSTAYAVERECDGSILVGYGLIAAAAKLNLAGSSLLYTLTSGKFRCGYRVIKNLGMVLDDSMVALVDLM